MAQLYGFTRKMTRFNSKTWDLVKRGFESGRSVDELSAEYGPARQTISKRAKAESWEVGNCIVEATPLMPAERVQVAVDQVAAGAPLAVACDYAGISHAAMVALRKEHPEIDLAIKRAKAEKTIQRLNNIESHGMKSWQATAFLLQQASDDKAIFSKPEEQSKAPQIILNVSRSDTIKAIAPDGSVLEID